MPLLGCQKKSNGMSAAKSFEYLAADTEATPYIQAIHERLLTQGVWIWKRGTIETHLGLSGKTPSCRMRFLGEFRSEQYQKSLPDYEGVKAMLNWVRRV
jgi:putative ATP-dependent endonuclease of OLD family